MTTPASFARRRDQMAPGGDAQDVAATRILFTALLCVAIALGAGCSSDSGPGEVDKGTVVVDPDPDGLHASWVLSGPGDYSHSGDSDATLAKMNAGTYTLTWADISGYVTPSPNPETQTLSADGTVTFTGVYSDTSGIKPPETVLVPAGSFIMGDGVAGCGAAEREVTLTRSFYLGRREVTNQEYMDAVQWAYNHGYATVGTSSGTYAVNDNLDGSSEILLHLGSGGCEIDFEGGVFSTSKPDHPVKEVSWYGAARYCDWLSLEAGLARAYEHTGKWLCNGGDPYGSEGYRLPTDAEWEYAAQYDDERIYPWGNDPPDCGRANCDTCETWTVPVGSYPDAPAELGLSDMVGNIGEWCNDWISHTCDLGTTPETDPVGPDSSAMRVIRGGYWLNPGIYLRCAYRNGHPPGTPQYMIGFRIARTSP